MSWSFTWHETVHASKQGFPANVAVPVTLVPIWSSCSDNAPEDPRLEALVALEALQVPAHAPSNETLTPLPLLPPPLPPLQAVKPVEESINSVARSAQEESGSRFMLVLRFNAIYAIPA